MTCVTQPRRGAPGSQAGAAAEHDASVVSDSFTQALNVLGRDPQARRKRRRGCLLLTA
jgi:hypothetical protein